MRLMPAPEAEQYLTSPPAASAAAAVELALSIRGATRIREHGLFIRDRVIHVLLSGRGRQVEADRRRLEELVPGLEELAPGPGAEAFHLAGERQSAVRVSTVPSRIVSVVSTLEASLGALSRAVIQPGVAQVDLPQPLISSGPAWPSSLEGEVSVRGTVPGTLRPYLSATVAPAGPESRWTRRLVEAFDPAGLFQTEGFPARC